MFDPSMTFATGGNRRGAITPMFALLLPVLLVLCGFAINLAYMQKVSTELKVATDAAAHAAGRAMSYHQTTDAAIVQARQTAQTNRVAGRVIQVAAPGDASGEDHLEVAFGRSIREDSGRGRYLFTEVPKEAVDDGSEVATSVAVEAHVNVPLVFQVMNYDYFGGNVSNFTARRRSVATQVDRDVALVLDRSGSMLYYKDDAGLKARLYQLYQDEETVSTPGYYKNGYWEQRRSGRWDWKGYHRPEDALPGWEIRDPNDQQWVPPETTTQRRISWSEYRDATKFLYDRTYTNNVIRQLERWENRAHTLGDYYHSSEYSKLTSHMAKFCHDWTYNSSRAAIYSRWYYLDQGVTAFLDILDATDQIEHCSLITFASGSRVDHQLLTNYQPIRNTVANIKPYGGTAIGDGMLEGLDPIVNGPDARKFASKTIVVLTDGENNNGTDPNTAVDQINNQHMVTIHTVTFSKGADKSSMEEVARKGNGRHYHADDGEGLVTIFEEIANTLPTLLTE